MPDWDSIKRRKIVDQQKRDAANSRRAQQEQQRLKDEKLAKVLRSDNKLRPEKPHGPMQVLLKSPYADAVNWAVLHAIRSPNDWHPVGRSVDALFFSYITHIIVKHPVPKHLYQCLTWKSNTCYPRDFFLRVAQGESVFKAMKETFTIPVTRKLAHLLMTATHGEEHPIRAIKLAQVLAYGGSRRLYQSLPSSKTPINTLNVVLGQNDFRSIDDEKFNDEVVAWLCRQTSAVVMFDYNQVEPMLDFFNHCRFENKAYTVVGRTLASVAKAMDDWHKFLGKGKGDGSAFPSCGIPSWSREVEYEEDGKVVKGLWEVKEILTDKRLREEGRDMRHCVASYAGMCKAGNCSIFSLTFQKEHGEVKKQVTMRFHAKSRTIVEARAFGNGKLANNQAATMRRWASENQISTGMYY